MRCGTFFKMNRGVITDKMYAEFGEKIGKLPGRLEGEIKQGPSLESLYSHKTHKLDLHQVS